MTAENSCPWIRGNKERAPDRAPVSPEAVQTLVGRPMTWEAIAHVAFEAVRGVVPRGDYKGASEYRRALAETLARRALAQAAAVTE